MTVSEGLTNCAAERTFLFDSYREMIAEVENAYNDSMVGLKAKLYDLLTAPDMTPEEIKTYSKSSENSMAGVEEKAIRIRSALYVSLYCAWESCLKDICSYFGIDVSDSKTYCFYNAIYKNTKKWDEGSLLHAMAELRNFCVHGTMKDNRINEIKMLAEQMPAWGIVVNGKTAYFKSYAALYTVLDFFNTRLAEAEQFASINHK